MSAALLKIAVAGASGRMGRMLVEAVAASDDCVLSGALDVAGSPALGSDPLAALGKSSGVRITADLQAGLAGADVLIDFTRPEGTLAHLAVCRQLGVRAVIGTTGFSDEQKALIAAAAQHIAIVMAPNMSLGVNVMLKLLDVAARALADGYDIEVIEAHHRHKVDAPSGTALAMGEVLAKASGRKLDDCAVCGPPRRDRRARPTQHRLCRHPRRRHRRRPHRAVRRHRRAHRDHAQERQPRHLCAGQPACGAFPGRARAGPLRHGRRARHLMQGLSDFWGQADLVGRAVAALLLAMSVAVWVLILWKSWVLKRAASDLGGAVPAFWDAVSLNDGRARLRRLDREALLLPLLDAATLVPGGGTLQSAGRLDSQLTRRLRDALHRGLAHLQFGQVVLASIGATAPFVGLFGTVWGIYHALASIAAAGTITIDKVAGPVGEALIMTAAGLAVAIPAVLAYNVFGKRVAACEAELEGFAHDLREMVLDHQALTWPSDAWNAMPARGR